MPFGISALSPNPYLTSQFRGPFLYNDATKADDKAADDKKADDTKKADDGKKSDDSAKARVEGALKKAEEAEKRALEAEKRLKEIDDAKKADEEKKLKEQGEHQKLAEQYKTESATEKAAREAAETRLKRFEEAAAKQVTDALDSIKDADKKKSVKALLDGLSVEEQLVKLPELLKLMGGAATFGKETTSSETATLNRDQKQKRYDELLLKERKEGLSGKEKNEKYTLMNELNKDWKPAT